MKPYSLEEIETEKNNIFPFKKQHAPIENTYVNYLPHANPQPFGIPVHYPYQ